MYNANKSQLMITLYERAVGALGHAIAGIESKDDRMAQEGVSTALHIISELDIALDTTTGTDVGDNLHRLYSFIGQRISQAAEDNDSQALREICGMLEELNHSWKVISS